MGADPAALRTFQTCAVKIKRANGSYQVIARKHDEKQTNRLPRPRSDGTNLGDSQTFCGLPADREGARFISLPSCADMVTGEIIDIHAQKEKTLQSAMKRISRVQE